MSTPEAWYSPITDKVHISCTPHQAQRIQEALDVALDHFSELNNGEYEDAQVVINLLRQPLIEAGVGAPI